MFVKRFLKITCYLLKRVNFKCFQECAKFGSKKSSKLSLIYVCKFIARKLPSKVPGFVEEVVRRKQIVIGFILNLENLFYP